MSGFVVTVDFQLKPGVRAAFRTLVDANARASCATEAACRRFDVIEPEDRPDTVLLYEVYDDRAGFDLHLASDHYRAFAAASEALCAAKTITTGTLVCEGGA
jgi:(4S)-4-hydroxy-5-phosphonooxypentane-2,3-dione isomerase